MNVYVIYILFHVSNFQYRVTCVTTPDMPVIFPSSATDICNCYPAILALVAEKFGVECKYLLDYMKNRPDWFEQIYDELGIPASDAKNTLIQISHQGEGQGPMVQTGKAYHGA